MTTRARIYRLRNLQWWTDTRIEIIIVSILLLMVKSNLEKDRYVECGIEKSNRSTHVASSASTSSSVRSLPLRGSCDGDIEVVSVDSLVIADYLLK